MSEATMKSNLCKAISSLHPQRIESPMTAPGIPDINHRYGWIEAKWLRSWPNKCDEQPVIFGHPLSKEQGIWLWKRRCAGGQALVAAQVAQDWFFWDGLDIRFYFNKMTRPEMIDRADLYMPRGLDKKRLISFLETH